MPRPSMVRKKDMLRFSSATKLAEMKRQGHTLNPRTLLCAIKNHPVVLISPRVLRLRGRVHRGGFLVPYSEQSLHERV
jgi:hypothetical protein